MLTYTLAPLSGDTEVTGHPIITLYVASSEKDGAFCVCMEVVAPDGQYRYVTEGVLRGIHRRTSEAPVKTKECGAVSQSQSVRCGAFDAGRGHQTLL